MTGNGARSAQASLETSTQATQAASATRPSAPGPAEAGRPAEGPPPSSSPGSTPTQTQASQTGHPRVIRISHQTVEPVVMMHMNIQGEFFTGVPLVGGDRVGYGIVE